MLAMDARWLDLDLRVLSNVKKRGWHHQPLFSSAPISQNGRARSMIATCFTFHREATAYRNVTLVMASGEEISGRALTAAVNALQAKLDDMTPPPMAA